MTTIDIAALVGTDTVNTAVARLREDAAFRAAARSNLNAAAKAFMGIDLPMPMKLIETDAGVTVGPADTDELTDNELELVAGGGEHVIAPLPDMTKAPTHTITYRTT